MKLDVDHRAIFAELPPSDGEPLLAAQTIQRLDQQPAVLERRRRPRAMNSPAPATIALPTFDPAHRSLPARLFQREQQSAQIARNTIDQRWILCRAWQFASEFNEFAPNVFEISKVFRVDLRF